MATGIRRRRRASRRSPPSLRSARRTGTGETPNDRAFLTIEFRIPYFKANSVQFSVLYVKMPWVSQILFGSHSRTLTQILFSKMNANEGWRLPPALCSGRVAAGRCLRRGSHARGIGRGSCRPAGDLPHGRHTRLSRTGFRTGISRLVRNATMVARLYTRRGDLAIGTRYPTSSRPAFTGLVIGAHASAGQPPPTSSRGAGTAPWRCGRVVAKPR